MPKRKAKALDWLRIARKWQRRWRVAKLFEADAQPGRPKFFLTFPYPYLNGYLHVGHTYSLTRVDIMARYKRAAGFAVLFPQAWHATGSPIDSAARRVAEGEPKQIAILKEAGFGEAQIKAFADPKHWIKVFAPAAKADMTALGCSIDWRRSFITTDLNPRYSAFIAWQFRKLKQLGYIGTGRHPVIWCPKEQVTVQDHDRIEGAGVVPEELVLIKFNLDGLILPAATFRPETVYGVTNLWLNPEIGYVEARIDAERWLIAQQAVQKLKDQGKSVEVLRQVKGSELLGQVCTNPVTGSSVPILPASFVTAEFGTGVVMSVPSHAPYDWAALKEIQASRPELKIKPISLIQLPGWGEHPAIEICEKMAITKQTDPKLVEATKEIYKKEFHSGILKPITGKYAGLTVQQAKDSIVADFVAEGKADIAFDTPQKVVCRCTSPCHVKIVEDQWFIKYGNLLWKELCLKALAQCKLYPEAIRPQFEYTIHWLKNWACARTVGLGTPLPWDRKWKIESLSDSTLYPAYYTIAHLITKVPIAKVKDALFDYVFLGIGTPEAVGIDPQLLQKMRQEFTYWYPVDFRNSGKDLVQNHLAFYLFNHAAIFPEQYWPAGIGVNGYVTLEKVKVSKSKGVFKLMRDLIAEFGPDIVRTAIVGVAEDLEDADWNPDFAFTLKGKLEAFYRFVLGSYGTTQQLKDIDRWLESKLHRAIAQATEAMESAKFRTALYKGFLELQSALKWYLRRRAGKPSRATLNQFIETQLKLLAPFAPHYCEELWSSIGKEGFISLEPWPKADASKINPELEKIEKILESALKDALEVLALAKLPKPSCVKFIIAADWKAKVVKAIQERLGRRDFKELVQAGIAAAPEHREQIPGLVQKLMKKPTLLPDVIVHQETEHAFFSDAKEFFESELGCPVAIELEQASSEPKAGLALPGRPAIVVK